MMIGSGERVQEGVQERVLRFFLMPPSHIKILQAL